jgi:hypothetical protein
MANEGLEINQVVFCNNLYIAGVSPIHILLAPNYVLSDVYPQNLQFAAIFESGANRVGKILLERNCLMNILLQGPTTTGSVSV